MDAKSEQVAALVKATAVLLKGIDPLSKSVSELTARFEMMAVSSAAWDVATTDLLAVARAFADVVTLQPLPA